jgi:hypothetical protein
MKHFRLLIIGLLTTWIISGCGGKKNEVSENDSDSVSTADIASKDKTLYGICGEGTAMNTLQLITDNGDTLNISIEHARDNNMVFGGLENMNKMAVLLAPDSSAIEVINMSTLLGNWIEPNPIDGSSMQGLTIKESGIATSIDNSVTFKTWRIFNGKLLLTYISEGSMNDDEVVDTFDIKSLGHDSLTISNINEIHQFSRHR